MNDATLLAETLAKCGLAMSSSEALRMANDITSTEKVVTRTFIEKTGQIENSYTKKKTYQDEIDELIQKTSPEKKNFHYMVRGYKEAETREKRGEERSVGTFRPIAPISSPEPQKPVEKPVMKVPQINDVVLDDSRALNEVLSGDQVCITVKPQEEEGVFVELEPKHDFTKEDDFLMPMEAKPKPEPVKVPEKAPEAPKVFKNPIPKVDIMGFFKKV